MFRQNFVMIRGVPGRVSRASWSWKTVFSGKLSPSFKQYLRVSLTPDGEWRIVLAGFLFLRPAPGNRKLYSFYGPPRLKSCKKKILNRTPYSFLFCKLRRNPILSTLTFSRKQEARPEAGSRNPDRKLEAGGWKPEAGARGRRSWKLDLKRKKKIKASKIDHYLCDGWLWYFMRWMIVLLKSFIQPDIM